MLFFVAKSDIYNFANDDTASCCGKLLDDILHNLKIDSGRILKWFK